MQRHVNENASKNDFSRAFVINFVVNTTPEQTITAVIGVEPTKKKHSLEHPY